jgi:hypothetical protein
MPVKFAVAELPTAAMHSDYDWGGARSDRQIEIAEQLDAVMPGKHDVELGRDFVTACHDPSFLGALAARNL